MVNNKQAQIKKRGRWQRLVAAAAAVAMAFGTPAVGQMETSRNKATTSPAAPVTQMSGAGLYDVDATGSDIGLVLEALARRSGVNIVVSPEVTGQVTAHLKQMSIDAIIEHLATVQGFGYKKTGDTYLIATKERFDPPKTEASMPTPPPPPENEVLVWKCRHIKAADLVAVVSNIFPDVKVVKGPESSSPTLQTGQSPTGGTGSGDSLGGRTGGSSGNSDDKATTVVLYGLPAEITRVRALLEKIDVRRAQLEVEVAITEVSSSSGKELGINWSWSDLILNESDPTNGGIRFGKFNKEGMTFTGTISALLESGSAKLLAQPNISVLDNEYAEILIGERILFPKLAGYTENGIPYYDVEEERVGIYLQIAPRITDEGEIILTLYPQVSLVTSFLQTQAGEYPQISTREARTTISVRDGATIAIGGLLRDDEIKQGSKIPLLGSLPIIGGLFRHTKTTVERTEIVIFLTLKTTKDGTAQVDDQASANVQ